MMLITALEEGYALPDLVEVLTCPQEDTPAEQHGKIYPPWYRRLG